MTTSRKISPRPTRVAAPGTKSTGKETEKIKGASEPQRTKSSSRSSKTLEIPLEIPEALKDLPKTASHLVHRAAKVLEEELAVGIAAAKEAEGRFIDVPKARSAPPEDLLQKFRQHGYEIIDIAVDLVYAASKSAERLSDSAVSFGTAGKQGSREAAKENIPTLAIEAAKAGDVSRTEMTLENGSEKPTAKFKFFSSDLVGTSGTRIPSSQISFEPSSMVIAPKNSEKVAIVVAVPKGTPADSYSGLIQATNLNQLKAILVVNVSK